MIEPEREMLEDSRIAIALAIADRALARRITAILAEIEEIELVPEAAGADLVLAEARTDPDDAADSEHAGLTLTKREAEVLALLAEGCSN